MDRLARIAALVRDIVWTILGVLLLAAVVFVLAGGAKDLLPAGLSSGGGGSGGASAPGQSAGPGPTSQGPAGTPAGGGQQPGSGPLTVNASGAFSGPAQGSSISATFSVQASQGSGGLVSFKVLTSKSPNPLGFTGAVECISPSPTNSQEVIVGGHIKTSTDATALPNGSGFVVGLISGSPGQVSFAAGFSLSATEQTGPCSMPLFDSNHPGYPLTSGTIAIQ